MTTLTYGGGMHTVDVPADPADRPRCERRTARVLVVDRIGRVLLFRDSDLGLDPVPHWWITPGGGVDPGESDVEAAVRELREETGLEIEPEALVGPVAKRQVLHGYSDVIVDQVEVFYGLRVSRFTPDRSGLTEEEQACFVDHGWFSRQELAHGVVPPRGEAVWPTNIGAIWEHFDALTAWSGREPLALPETEESTVAV